MVNATRRTGAETKTAAERIALSLFISQGYQATSPRQIADALGINKASLYYHFKNKEEIVASAMAARAAEAEELLQWASAQPPDPDLVDRTALRWVDSMSVEKLRGIRFLNANPGLMRTLGAGPGRVIGDALSATVDLLVDDANDKVRIALVRMALVSINAAVSASSGSALTDDEIVAAAREAALGILDRAHRFETTR